MRLRSLLRAYTIELQTLEEDAAAAVQKHRTVLHAKRETLVTTDDYGELDIAAWQRETVYFLTRFANFESRVDSLRDNLRDAEADGVGETITATLLNDFLATVPLHTVEAALGFRKPRRPGPYDEEASRIRHGTHDLLMREFGIDLSDDNR